MALTGKTICISMIVSGLVVVSAHQSEAKAKTHFVGFKQGKESKSVPQGWEIITYFMRAENELSLSKEGKRTVLRVRSLGSASALLKRVDVDLEAFPVLVWRWKVNRVVGMAVEGRRDRNDAAARIRVIFGRPTPKPTQKPPELPDLFKSFSFKLGSREPGGFKIDYIWGNTIAKGEVVDFPGSRNHKMVVVESGSGKADKWVWEKRNLIEDFEQLFRRSPPHLIGVVVLTDTDHTNEGVVAHYSSIVLMKN
jgi:hypothetical protein